MHIHRAGNPVPWPSVPVGSWRFWDAHVAWADMAPHKGEYHFEYLDRYLALAEEHNAEVLYPLGLTPRWASSRPDEKSAYQPGWAAEPRDIEDWRNYVTTIVEHCKGRVHAYEIWNEPNYKPFWTGDVDGVLRLTREASQIIRKLDPQAVIVSPAATTASGTKWLAEFLSKGGGQFVDVIGYHFYVNTQPPEAILPIIAQVKKIMADNHQSAKPLWNTEIGWLRPSQFASEDLCAAYLARTYILAWAAGVQRTYWYAWDSGPPLEMVEHDFRTLKPAGQAYGVIHSWLVGARLNNCRMDAAFHLDLRIESQRRHAMDYLERRRTRKPFPYLASGTQKHHASPAKCPRHHRCVSRSWTRSSFDHLDQPISETRHLKMRATSSKRPK